MNVATHVLVYVARCASAAPSERERLCTECENYNEVTFDHKYMYFDVSY